MTDPSAELAEARLALVHRDRLIARIAHELRSPVATLLLWETILRGTLDDEVRGQALDAIRRCAQSQESLVSGMLDLARLLAGALELDRRPLAIGEAVVDALGRVAARAADKQVSIERRDGGELELVSADQARLRQILSSLLSSVVDRAEPGSRIVVSVRRAAASIVIDVTADDGATATAPTLGDDAPGGIELALARELAVLHGGTFVTSRSGDIPSARCTLPTAS